ncbi:MAG: hypothetical protein GEU28_02075 [Dehalococcoidia bacterium]|nr:hypothetical protein [Dehalococcoidia bacterium]
MNRSKSIALGVLLFSGILLAGCGMGAVASQCTTEFAGQTIDSCNSDNSGSDANDQSPVVEAGGHSVEVAVTYYTCEDGFCGTTASGTTVGPGTAACDPGWMGRSFVIYGDPNGRTYTCRDTGGAVSGNHVDIWFATHAEGQALIAAVGTTATIEFR